MYWQKSKKILCAVLCVTLTVAALCFSTYAAPEAEPLRFLVISDLHEGAGELESAILDGAFEQITTYGEYDGYDIVLISGDLTDHGSKAEHQRFLQKLQVLENAGKTVYLTTGNHDYRSGDAYYARTELPALYADYGYGAAIATFEGLSYAAQLAPGYRLLVLNFDNGRVFTQEQLAWALEQVGQAKAAGDQIIGMWHFATLNSLPIYDFASGTAVHGGEEAVAVLADAGLTFGFCGHTHVQNIDFIQTKQGNRFYEINTASLVKSPSSPIRKVVLDKDSLDVRATYTEICDFDLGGQPLSQFLYDRFADDTVRGVLEALATDPALIAGVIGYNVDFGPLGSLITLFGKMLNNLDFNTVGWLFLCPWVIDESIRERKLADFLVEAANGMYTGEKKYSPDTPEGRAFRAVLFRLDLIYVPLTFVLGTLFDVNMPFTSLKAFFEPLLYSPVPSNDAVLTLSGVKS